MNQCKKNIQYIKLGDEEQQCFRTIGIIIKNYFAFCLHHYYFANCIIVFSLFCFILEKDDSVWNS